MDALAQAVDGATPLHEAAGALPEIPLVEAGDAVALVDAERARAEALVAAARRDYGSLFFAIAEGFSRRWLAAAANPYLGELDAVAARIGRPGAYLLNLSYEWFCTSAVAADPTGSGNRMLRTLDWPLEGLGRYLVVARQGGAGGAYYNITWPGFVGAVTAMAPGRFAAAFNQAPMRRFGRPLALDWLRNRVRVWRSRSLPPAHLLRRVFDRCGSYAEAKKQLSEVPICLPVFFILSGVEAGEGCVIERLEDRAIVHEAPACVTNHWLTPGLGGDPRGFESRARLALMTSLHERAPGGFGWLVPPILNACTRLAVVANAAAGRLAVQGFEADGPVTSVLRLGQSASEAAP